MSRSHIYEKQSSESLIMENGIIKEHKQITKENEDGHIKIQGIMNGKSIYIEKNPPEFRHNNNVTFIEDDNNFREFRVVPMKIVRMPTPYPLKRKSARSLKTKRSSKRKIAKGKTAKNRTK